MTLTDQLRQWAWRLRRSRAGSGRPPSGGAVERFSLFDGRLRLRGTIPVPGPVRSASLVLPGGERLPCPVAPAGAAVRIDAAWEVGTDALEVASARLELALAGGGVVTVDGLGAPLDDPAHLLAADFRQRLAEAPPGALLEVGSRARSGVTRRDWAPPGWAYSGCDIKPGPNVDVVGDAHALSRLYPAEQFDAAMAFSVLEHLLMPWKFVLELNRVLKVGAVGLFTTHQTWPLHDAPWDFWRYSDKAWAGLLNRATGFEIIGARLGEPAFLVAERCSPTTAFADRPAAYLASFVLFRKVGPTSLDWPVELPDIIASSYPTG